VVVVEVEERKQEKVVEEGHWKLVVGLEAEQL